MMARMMDDSLHGNSTPPCVAIIRGKTDAGSGFLVQPGILATTTRVLDDIMPEDLLVAFPGSESPGRGPGGESVVTATVLAFDAGRDVALLRVESNLPPLEMAASWDVPRTTSVRAFGASGVLGDEVAIGGRTYRAIRLAGSPTGTERGGFNPFLPAEPQVGMLASYGLMGPGRMIGGMMG